MFRPSHQPSLLHRLTAVLGVALVLILSVLAANPKLHAWVHGPETTANRAAPGHEPVGDTDHACAVTLFAGGVESLLDFFLLMLVRPLAHSIVLRASDWLVAAQPRYWHVPSHAPPLV